MPNTPNAGLRYPDLTSAPNVPLDLGNLASDIDTKLAHVTVATTAARDSLIKFTGMRVYVTADKRIYLWDGTVFQYAGGAPPPIVALTGQTGWAAVGSYAPGAFKDASGIVRFVGGVMNSPNPYTPSGQVALTVPVGYRPAQNQSFNILIVGQPSTVTCTVYAPTGNVTMDAWGGSGSIGAGTVHTLDQISYHPGYTGTVPLL